MKCYFRLCYDGAQWSKGNLTSLYGNTVQDFSIVDEKGEFKASVCQLSNTEVRFASNYMTLTGFTENKNEPTGQKSYHLTSVDVSGGWVKPKDNI